MKFKKGDKALFIDNNNLVVVTIQEVLERDQSMFPVVALDANMNFHSFTTNGYWNTSDPMPRLFPIPKELEPTKPVEPIGREKAPYNWPDFVSGNDLEKIASMSLSESNFHATWFAIDPDGSVWAYDEKPVLGRLSVWQTNDPRRGRAWKITRLLPPFMVQCYEIMKVIPNEPQKP